MTDRMIYNKAVLTKSGKGRGVWEDLPWGWSDEVVQGVRVKAERQMTARRT